MKVQTLTILAFASVFATPFTLRSPHESWICDLVYHPTKLPTADLSNADLLVGRVPKNREGVHSPQPPTRMEIGTAIFQQGPRDFNIMGWDISFIPRDSDSDALKYSVIATQRGSREYYYSALTEVVSGRIRIWVSPPIPIYICANGNEIDPISACTDGSKSQPLIKH